MNKYIAYKGFTIRIKTLNKEKREFLIEIYPIDSGPSMWGNAIGAPSYLLKKYKKRIDRYWEKPESERTLLN